MHRRVSLFVLVALVLAALSAACGSETQVVTGAPVSGITVQGTGKVTAPTDTGIVTFGVQVTADTVSEARDRAAESANAVFDAARDNDVDEEDIRTVQFSVTPRYEYRKEETVLIGFEVTNLVEVTVRKLDDFSDILDDAIEAGGDDVRVSGIQFTIEDTSDLLERARELAMNDAGEKAKQLADLADVDLGKPLTITESQSTSLPPEAAGRDVADDAFTPIQPGTGLITVSVSVVYAIDD